MEAIRVYVNKKMDGYSFSLMPLERQLIRSWFPGSHPANGIFVAYDVKFDLGGYISKLENQIYPADVSLFPSSFILYNPYMQVFFKRKTQHEPVVPNLGDLTMALLEGDPALPFTIKQLNHVLRCAYQIG